MSDRLPPSLFTALADLMRWAQASGIPIVVIGGVAASLLGRTRLTRDIDALVNIDESHWQAALSQSQQFGFSARIDDAVEFAKRSRVLLLRHVATEIEIDVVLSALPFEQDAVNNSRLLEIEGINISLPRVEDLLIMKAIAHRPRDMSDIEGLIDANSNIDLDLVKRWVREFAIASTMPEIIADFEKIVMMKGR